ncbi:MerR family DNA-binding protein [Pseudomonas aeruginosa]|nr:MerR family DNA-binding protein [Pseudomonas aeruginosa]
MFRVISVATTESTTAWRNLHGGHWRTIKSTGCHIETIRYYEKIGLLPPADRSAGKHRIYTDIHKSRLIFIRQNRDLGFPLEDIRELITLAADTNNLCGDALAVVKKHLAAIEVKVANLRGYGLSYSRCQALANRPA